VSDEPDETDHSSRSDAGQDGDPYDDVATGPTIPRRLLTGASEQPVLAVFVVVLLLLAVGFFVAGALFFGELLSGDVPR
jgi:hypothetical protein